ncbi:hypothetical protein Tco_1484588 [Tanacetum coccineum]
MSKKLEEHGFVSTIQQRTNHKDLQNCLFACFLSQEEPKKVIHALKDPSWIEAMQEELLQFKLQEVWTLVDLPNGKRAIGTKWVKTVNGEVQLHALVDGKKIIINESNVRRDLKLEDAEGIDYLPNSIIFEQLALMGAKTTAWNEFSSTIASAIILFVNQQLDGLPSHMRIYDAPSHTKKIFGNMKRVGKGFPGRVTPLFPTMVVQNQSELGKGSAMPTDPQHTPTFIQSSTQPQKTQKPRKPKIKDT